MCTLTSADGRITSQSIEDQHRGKNQNCQQNQKGEGWLRVRIAFAHFEHFSALAFFLLLLPVAC